MHSQVHTQSFILLFSLGMILVHNLQIMITNHGH